LAVALVIWWRYSTQTVRILQRWWPAVLGIILLSVASIYVSRNSYFFQHYIVHSDPAEQVVDLDSNDYHLLYVREGLEGIADRPLGHGPGTAGIVSIQNPNGGQLTENYYIQIGYEVGILGLALFAAINIWLYVRLWRYGGSLGKVLCAGFWAYVLMNMLLHMWSNEAVAAQWWLLAGVALIGVGPRATADADVD
jgi:hypothetical protein